MAKLPLATIREVLNIVDSGGNVPEAMRRTQESLIGEIPEEQDEPKGWDAAQELLDAEIAKRGCRRQSWDDRYFNAADGDFRF